MHRRRRTTRRGLSLLELILATTVTAMIATAIAGMLTAVSTGVGSRRDGRTAMVRTNAANTRLGSYVTPARCILAVYPDSGIVLWQDDSRESDSVHATEVRWLLYDADSNSFDVHFVSFPDDWTEAARDLADTELPSDSNWMTVLATFEAAGHVGTIPLVDALEGVTITVDAIDPLDAHCVYFDLDMQSGEGVLQTRIAASVLYRKVPTL